MDLLYFFNSEILNYANYENDEKISKKDEKRVCKECKKTADLKMDATAMKSYEICFLLKL